MVVFLNVFRIKKDGSNEKLGTLEIGKNAPSETSDGRFFEWRGSNGTSDGGTWKFRSNPDFYAYDNVMLLTSNLSNKVIVTIFNSDWGLTEPTEPFFKSGAKGKLSYEIMEGKSIVADWERV